MTSTGEGDVVRVLSVRRVPMTTTCSTSAASCLAASASAATETLGMVSKAIEAVDASNPTATRIRWAFLNFPPCLFCGDQGHILPVSIFDGGLAVFDILSMEARHERAGWSERKRFAALTDDRGGLHALTSRWSVVSRTRLHSGTPAPHPTPPSAFWISRKSRGPGADTGWQEGAVPSIGPSPLAGEGGPRSGSDEGSTSPVGSSDPRYSAIASTTPYPSAAPTPSPARGEGLHSGAKQQPSRCVYAEGASLRGREGAGVPADLLDSALALAGANPAVAPVVPMVQHRTDIAGVFVVGARVLRIVPGRSAVVSR